MQHDSEIKWEMIRWIGHTAWGGKIRNSYAILRRISQTKKSRKIPNVYVGNSIRFELG
jgi:hypothetical protein